MAILFSNISEFKNHVGGSVNQSLEIASIAATIEDVAYEVIEPWLGEKTLQNLINPPDNLDAQQLQALETLKPYVQKPLAKLSLHVYTKVGNVEFGESGFTRPEVTAFKYQENDFRATHLHYGYEALERMLKFLDQNETNYPDWMASSARERNRELFLMYASEFRDCHDKKVSRFVYKAIRGIISEMEDDYIEPLIGTPFFEDLKELHSKKLLGIALSTDPILVEQAEKEKKLLKLIQKAIAHLTIQTAIKRDWIFYDGDKVGVKERLEPQSYVKEGPASGQAISLRIRTHQTQANRHLHRIHCFLQENMDTFTTYKDWWEDMYPPQEETDNLLLREEAAEKKKSRSIVRF